ncbi:MAG: ABC transporter ATP-binding protein [Alphaproteobacteria bacterium]|nr:ABC transporter ATP-binding protein [Alphaproteobacteria bacterium]
MELVVDGVGHAYDGLAVLDGIELAVRDGEVLALIGPSGCGKSTLLGILGGMLQPTRGAVRLKGDPPAGTLNPFTYVFQDFALLPWRTVEGNVSLALEHHVLDAGERGAAVDEVLSLTGLSEFRSALPKQLSGGMRQRVGIARALAARPAVLLLDEPLSALDAQTRDLLLEDFERLWALRRVTAVYVTHNLDEALRLADRIVVLSRRPGRIREIVAVDVSRPQRGVATLAGLRDRLWRLIRDEAASADREIVAHEAA